MNHCDSLSLMHLTEQALEKTGRQTTRMSTVGRPSQLARFIRPARVDGYAYCAIDAILDVDRQPRIIEVNGSNAGASSLGDPEGDRRRAEHQIKAALPRIQSNTRGAILVCFAENTLILSEIYTRAYMLYELVSQHNECQFGNSEIDPTSPFVVACDSVARIAAHITTVNGQLFYRGYPVMSVGNVNLLAELVRKGVVKRQGADYDVDYDVFHDGPLSPLMHDKGAQQILANGTGFVPIRHFDAMTVEEIVAGVKSFQRDGHPAVIKPNATSGGAGIQFFGLDATDAEIRRTLDQQVQEVVDKYGQKAIRSMLPIRIFEFAQSTGYPVGNNSHLWDMRISCLISPGEIEMTVCGMRICPKHFVFGNYDRASVCSNTTGRAPSTDYLRAPLAESDGPTEFLTSAGVDDRSFDSILDGCAAFCEKAYSQYSKERLKYQTPAEIAAE